MKRVANDYLTVTIEISNIMVQVYLGESQKWIL